MRVSAILPIAAGILGVLLAGPGQAAIYKWVDAQGQVHFSDQPHGKKTKKLEIHNTVTPEQQREAAKITKTYESLDKQYDQEQAARKAKEQAQAQARAQRAIRCRELTREANVAEQHPLVRFKQDGTPQYLTDRQTSAYRQRLQRLKQANCSGSR